MLRELSADSKTVCLDENSILSPSARDYAREKGLVVYLNGLKDPIVGVSTGEQHCPAEKQVQKCSAEVKSAADGKISIDTDTLKAVIAKAILENNKQNNKPICENPKAMKVDGDKVVMEPFAEAPAGQKVLLDRRHYRAGRQSRSGLYDLLKTQNCRGPCNMTKWITLWRVEFTIKTGGKLYTMKPGDVFHIPKGTSVVFGSPSFGKVFYAVYPSNWMAQMKITG